VDINILTSRVLVTIECPILLSINQSYKPFHYPILKNFELSKVFPPEKIWIMLSEWLSKRKDPIIIDKRTDKEKILSNGFDLKTSFRKM